MANLRSDEQKSHVGSARWIRLQVKLEDVLLELHQIEICRYWDTYHLGDEFRTRINSFNIDNTNLFPLLHRSIAGGKFLQSHDYFCRSDGANYFDYIGKEIASITIKNKDNLKIWL